MREERFQAENEQIPSETSQSETGPETVRGEKLAIVLLPPVADGEATGWRQVAGRGGRRGPTGADGGRRGDDGSVECRLRPSLAGYDFPEAGDWDRRPVGSILNRS
jgi:hypothetical protein